MPNPKANFQKHAIELLNSFIASTVFLKLNLAIESTNVYYSGKIKLFILTFNLVTPPVYIVNKSKIVAKFFFKLYVSLKNTK